MLWPELTWSIGSSIGMITSWPLRKTVPQNQGLFEALAIPPPCTFGCFQFEDKDSQISSHVHYPLLYLDVCLKILTLNDCNLTCTCLWGQRCLNHATEEVWCQRFKILKDTPAKVLTHERTLPRYSMRRGQRRRKNEGLVERTNRKSMCNYLGSQPWNCMITHVNWWLQKAAGTCHKFCPRLARCLCSSLAMQNFCRLGTHAKLNTFGFCIYFSRNEQPLSCKLMATAVYSV